MPSSYELEKAKEAKTEVDLGSSRWSHRQILFLRLLKTALLILTWVAIGLFGEITGPTLQDLKLRVNTTYEEVSKAIEGRSAGFFAGAVLGGFLVDRFKGKADLLIAVSLSIAAGATVAAAWMPTISLMWFMFFTQGTCEGVINIAGQDVILMLWAEKAAAPLHLLHLGFGIGSFIVPLVADPFLAVKNPVLGNETFANSTQWTTTIFPVTTLAPATTMEMNSTSEYIRESRIEYAYMIVGIYVFCYASVFYIYFAKGDPPEIYKQGVSEKHTKVISGWRDYLKLIDPATCADGKRIAGFLLFLLLFLHFYQAVGGERIYGKFIRAFSIDQLEFSGTDATLLNSSFWISFSVGRFLGFVGAIFIPIRILIFIECFGALGIAVLLNIFGYYNSTALWVLTQPMGIFIAPLFPTGIAWSDHYLKMSGLGIMVLLAGGSVGGIMYMWIAGYLYDIYGPRSFLYMVTAYGAAACTVVTLLSLVGCWHGDRFEKAAMKEAEEEKGVDAPQAINDSAV